MKAVFSNFKNGKSALGCAISLKPENTINATKAVGIPKRPVAKPRPANFDP